MMMKDYRQNDSPLPSIHESLKGLAISKEWLLDETLPAQIRCLALRVVWCRAINASMSINGEQTSEILDMTLLSVMNIISICSNAMREQKKASLSPSSYQLSIIMSHLLYLKDSTKLFIAKNMQGLLNIEHTYDWDVYPKTVIGNADNDG